jgi:hypothetical protein
MVGRPAYAAVRLADFFDELRFEDDRLRRRPRWRVEVSKGLWVDAGLSCRAHQSVLLYRESRTSHCGSMQIRPVPYTSGGMLPAKPSAKNDPSSTGRLSTMSVLPLRIRIDVSLRVSVSMSAFLEIPSA